MNHRLKILHVIIGLETGGAELFLMRLALSQSINSQVAIVSLTDVPVTKKKELEVNGIDIHCLNLTGIFSLLSVLRDLRRIIYQFTPDIVQSWMYHSDFISSIANFGNRNILVWSVRNTFLPTGSRITSILMRVCSLLSRISPKKVCYVAEASKAYHESKGYDKSKSVVIGNGYDFSNLEFSRDARDSIRDFLGLSSNETLIGVVGRYHLDKGQDIFIEALTRIRNECRNTRAVLIGRGCSKNNIELLSLIRRYDLDEYLILADEQDKISHWLSAIDIYVMPSRTEGFPNALAEAMALGLPCIATDVGDARSLGCDFVRFCTPEADDLANEICKMVQLDENVKFELGEKTKLHMHNNYSIAEIERQYYQLYINLLESN
ncbi:glycosyltransferase [Aeromonas veronii]|uniref:glycosyltransferase n=1 Tax=Aeromonas veronii TaxID=654 RepID=UPI002A58F09B|nr:glycosyltransferase [Aeromonas veronii]